jgi:hypothetical protein
MLCALTSSNDIVWVTFLQHSDDNNVYTHIFSSLYHNNCDISLGDIDLSSLV